MGGWGGGGGGESKGGVKQKISIKDFSTSFFDYADNFLTHFLMYLPAQIFIMATQNCSLLLNFGVTGKTFFKETK